MNQLEQARQTIDAVDREMAALFEKRMDAVRSLVRYKQENGMPILDAAREAAVVEKNLAHIQNPEYAGFYTDFIQHTMGLSRQFQSRLIGRNRVAYPGLEGSYAHVALKKLFPACQAVRYPTWEKVFAVVEAGDADAGIVPFEDNHVGDIATILDLCFRHRLYIRMVYDFPVVHSLLALPGAQLWQIREVYSQPQALRQSETFLHTMDLPGHPMPSAAQAAQFVAQSKDPSLAAIASPETAAAYGLVELATGIHSENRVTARFLILTREKPTDGNRFSLLFTVDNQPGKLAQVIQEIGRWGFNMETIQSHPRPDVPGSYYFYAELAGTLQQAESLVSALRDVCQTIQLLGVYQR